MNPDTNNGNEHIDVNADVNSNVNTNDNDSGNEGLTSDPTLAKHLDIAIEAQDGTSSNTGASSGEAKDKDGNQQQADPKAGTGNKSDSGAQQQSKQEGQKKEGNTAGPKDLVIKDAAGNDVVIKGGAERRFYEQMQTARQETAVVRQQLDDATRQLRETQQRLQSTIETVQSVNGVPPQQLAVANRLFTDLQRDPVTTLKKLLAEAVAAGHTIENIGAGVDAQAIKAILAKEMAPLTTQNAQPSDDELRVEAEREAAQFFSQFPDAKPHDALIARLMRENPGVELHTAYFQLKNAFIERGFDWSRPLDEQLAERNQQQQQTSSQGANTQQQQQAPMTQGRNVVQADPASTTVTVAHESTDMGDIVREAMREAGMNV